MDVRSHPLCIEALARGVQYHDLISNEDPQSLLGITFKSPLIEVSNAGEEL